jgi:hypothetical protein
MELNQLANNLLHASKLGNNLSDLQIQLAQFTRKQVAFALVTDAEKLAFWLNLYNAFVIKELSNTDLYSGFYSKKIIQFKDFEVSFDDIEHNILRKGKHKWTLGLVNKTNKEFSDLMVTKLDARIHFALNCGANSCPPISFYHSNTIEEQLTASTINYLKDTTIIKNKGKLIRVPRLFLWYIGDFGGFSGIRNMYKKYGILPFDCQPRIAFLSYDWSLNIDNFTPEYSR